ncbi:MAG: D-aminoacylase [Planctomycetes bacterium]|nr:D-aminoacylase [Planctomycetota bacterium]
MNPRLRSPELPLLLLAILAFAGWSCFVSPPEARYAPRYDLVVRGGLLYDGSGGSPYRADIAVTGDRIAAIGNLEGAQAQRWIDAQGCAVAPGFINVLSWANESLLVDGRSLSDLRQGVTLEVLGEGESMGPLTEAMRAEMLARQGDLRFEVPWTTLGEYLEHLEERGIATNVASFVGAATVRQHVLGSVDRAPSEAELAAMQQLVRDAMEEGALGVASALIYAPGAYAKTEELVALASAAQPYGGLYISHLRSEADRFLEALDELIEIAERAQVRAEVYHLKAAGEKNWPKLEAAIAKIEAARARGISITADMYLYTAGATGLDAAMPPWVQEGGFEAWRARLRDPALRARVELEMRTPSDAWESLLLAAGSAERVMLVGFRSEALKPLTGKTLAEVAAARGVSVERCAMDLVVEDGSRVEAVYFLMSEENVRKQVRLPWMSFCSDAASLAPEGAFLRSNPHPRAYGNFARLLGHYVGDEYLVPLQEAIRRLTSFPADTLRLEQRGRVSVGAFADLVVFQPEAIRDHATFEQPHQLATGVRHVLVNGVPVLLEGEVTEARPGRFVRGPGCSR